MQTYTSNSSSEDSVFLANIPSDKLPLNLSWSVFLPLSPDLLLRPLDLLLLPLDQLRLPRNLSLSRSLSLGGLKGLSLGLYTPPLPGGLTLKVCKLDMDFVYTLYSETCNKFIKLCFFYQYYKFSKRLFCTLYFQIIRANIFQDVFYVPLISVSMVPLFTI